MEWNFEVISSWETLWSESNVLRWTQLIDNSFNSHVFFHPTLVKAWLETYIPIRNLDPLILWGCNNSGNQVFFPLVIWHKNWRNSFITSIVPVGYSDFDYHDPIFRRNLESFDNFWNDCIAFLKNNYSFDTIEIDGIRDYCVGHGNGWLRQEPCPFLDLSNIQNHDDLMKFFKTSLRGDIRRQIRRLTEIGNLSFKEYHSVSEVQKTFDSFLYSHTEKWPKAYKAPHFHENMIKEALEKGVLHFSSLNLDKKAISWHLGFSYKGVYYYYMPAGDKDYARYSPVKVHLYFLLDKMVSNGYKKYDHLRGEENYKSGWANGVDYVNNLCLQNESLSSQTKVFINGKVRQLIR